MDLEILQPESVYSHGVDMDHIAFSQDGSRFYILENDGDLKQYTLSTPYDISTKTSRRTEKS